MASADPSARRLTVIDSGRSHFRPRARLLRTIGAELISSEVVAVIELVRNSYDADSTEVTLSFAGTANPGEGVIELRDNGHGMGRDVLLGPWLEPATIHKGAHVAGGKTDGYSNRGRRQLGSKGVGRFAAQRLGNHLELFTRVPSGETELKATFDWNALSRADQYLSEVTIPWREASPERITDGSGTALVITDLQDAWDAPRFERLRVGLSRLVSPDFSAKDSFTIFIEIDGMREKIEPAIYQRQPMYSVWGEVKDGIVRLSYQGLETEGEPDTLERTVTWHPGAVNAGPISFHINAWDLDKEALNRFRDMTGSTLGLRDYRRSIREVSGISLYRDGFRILPYGEPDNDWLRLDRRRVNNPTMRLSNNQLLGWIQLSADDNPLLKDQTNREGLVSNEAYTHLVEMVLDLVNLLENKRFAARRAMNLGTAKKIQALPEMINARNASIASLFDRLGAEGSNEGHIITQLRAEVEERGRELANSVQQYASLAAVGQVSTLVVSQLRHPLKQIRSDLRQLKGDLEEDELEPDDIEDMRTSLDLIFGHLEDMTDRLTRLDPIAVASRNRKPTPEDLDELLENVLRAHAQVLGKLTIAYDVEGKAVVQTTPSVMQQIAALLLDNAMYWVSKREKDRVIRFKVTKAGFSIYNNGPPISAEDREFIFEAHYGRKPDGAGLGLPLAKDLAHSIGADIEELGLLAGAEFRVRLG